MGNVLAMETEELAVSHAEMTWQAYLTNVIVDGGTIIRNNQGTMQMHGGENKELYQKERLDSIMKINLLI